MAKHRAKDLLNSFPRSRPLITKRHAAIYLQEYALNRSGSGLLYGSITLLESWMHHKIAKLTVRENILELGAGTLNHVPYEARFTRYDCVEPLSQLYSNSPYIGRVRNIYQDIRDLPKNVYYDKIISVAVLEHLLDLPLVLARCGLLLTHDGVFQAGIPSEGGFLWGAGWRLTSGLWYRIRTGLDYKTVMRHEHVNNATEIIDIIYYFFDKVTIQRFPTPWHHFSLYTYLEARHPKVGVCKIYAS